MANSVRWSKEPGLFDRNYKDARQSVFLYSWKDTRPGIKKNGLNSIIYLIFMGGIVLPGEKESIILQILQNRGIDGRTTW